MKRMINMTVLSQDRKIIFSGKNFSAEKNLGGGKDKKYVIIGYTKGNMSSRVRAYYKEEKEAVDELSKLFDAIESGRDTYSFS